MVPCTPKRTLQWLLARKAAYARVVATFNGSPKKGVAALEAALAAPLTPRDVAMFLRFARGLDKAAVGNCVPAHPCVPHLYRMPIVTVFRNTRALIARPSKRGCGLAIRMTSLWFGPLGGATFSSLCGLDW